MRLTLLLLVLLCAGCNVHPVGPPRHLASYESHDATVVDQVVPAALEGLGLEVRVHEFAGGRGYVEAHSPTGAMTVVRYEWVVQGLTWITVGSTRDYGSRLSDAVYEAILAGLDEVAWADE